MKVKKWGFDEGLAYHRYPHGRQCPERGEGLPHRVGDFPFSSPIDGGTPGTFTNGICIHCGRTFPSLKFFYPRQIAQNETSATGEK